MGWQSARHLARAPRYIRLGVFQGSFLPGAIMPLRGSSGHAHLILLDGAKVLRNLPLSSVTSWPSSSLQGLLGVGLFSPLNTRQLGYKPSRIHHSTPAECKDRHTRLSWGAGMPQCVQTSPRIRFWTFHVTLRSGTCVWLSHWARPHGSSVLLLWALGLCWSQPPPWPAPISQGCLGSWSRLPHCSGDWEQHLPAAWHSTSRIIMMAESQKQS